MIAFNRSRKSVLDVPKGFKFLRRPITGTNDDRISTTSCPSWGLCVRVMLRLTYALVLFVVLDFIRKGTTEHDIHPELVGDTLEVYLVQNLLAFLIRLYRPSDNNKPVLSQLVSSDETIISTHSPS